MFLIKKKKKTVSGFFKGLNLAGEKNFSAVYSLQLAPCLRVRRRTGAVNGRLHFRGFQRWIAVSALAGTAAPRRLTATACSDSPPGVLRTLDPPTLIRGRAAGLAPPALGAVEQSVTSRGRAASGKF